MPRIRRDIAQLRQGGQLVQNDARPLVQFGDIGVLQGVLVLRRADAAADLDVLANLHIERDAFDPGHLPLQAIHDLCRRRIALRERLQIDQHAALAERPASPIQ